MFGLFLVSALFIGGAANATHVCAQNNIEAPRECASFIWENREGVPITQEVYKNRFND
jgi:hypothetical protein